MNLNFLKNATKVGKICVKFENKGVSDICPDGPMDAQT